MALKTRPLIALTASAATLALVSGCAGGVTASDGDSGDSVEFGADVQAFHDALADMDPVEITFQAGSRSGTDHTGAREQVFADAIEEYSGGKITVNTVWGQPIAPYDEVTEAVADGRIDIGLEIPIYTPTKYPAITSLINIAPTAPADPYFYEMVTTAAAQDVAWNTDEILDDYRDKGVDVLVPLEFEYSGALACTEPVSSADDLNGKQVRVASAADFAIAESLGTTPVSMQYVETYEALQRNTIDCTFGALKIQTGSGFLEVAPNVVFPTESSFSRNPTSIITGAKIEALPIAAQQLIFDQALTYFYGHHEAKAKYNSEAIAEIDEFGGDVGQLDAVAEEKLTAALDGLRQQTVETDALDGDALIADFDAALEKWEGVATELGYAPSGDYREFAETFDAEPFTVDDFAARVFEEVYLPHRPS